MNFDVERIENKKSGKPATISNEQIIEALESGLFESYSAIARYFGVTPSAISKRVKKLREQGLIK